ncbi:hypothetical protein DENSPDRAFT_454663 [Dentipellis sp. KUC8613]|nr:hypothetical protein DENSPDRAFT_454663 [Dentipellis sp. KUC8613]
MCLFRMSARSIGGVAGWQRDARIAAWNSESVLELKFREKRSSRALPHSSSPLREECAGTCMIIFNVLLPVTVCQLTAER